MILEAHQKVKICARALIFEDNELVLTSWKDHFDFLIGGRVDFGEPVIDALYREVNEETGALVTSTKFVYFNEHVYGDTHEFAWYFYTTLDRSICGKGEILPNPDHHDLFIRRRPVTLEGLVNIRPPFLQKHLPDDYQNLFISPPRHLYSQGEFDPLSPIIDFSEYFR